MGELRVAGAGKDSGLEAVEALDGLREGNDLGGADEAIGDRQKRHRQVVRLCYQIEDRTQNGKERGGSSAAHVKTTTVARGGKEELSCVTENIWADACAGEVDDGAEDTYVKSRG